MQAGAGIMCRVGARVRPSRLPLLLSFLVHFTTTTGACVCLCVCFSRVDLSSFLLFYPAEEVAYPH